MIFSCQIEFDLGQISGEPGVKATNVSYQFSNNIYEAKEKSIKSAHNQVLRRGYVLKETEFRNSIESIEVNKASVFDYIRNRRVYKSFIISKN